MLEWHLLKAHRGGFSEVVINTAHCAEQFRKYERKDLFPGMTIRISEEGPTFADALETKGGIVNALPLLTRGREPFAVISGDVLTAYDYGRLREAGNHVGYGAYAAHLVLVPNPYFKSIGDMHIEAGRIFKFPKTFTYGNLAVFSPEIFEGESSAKAPLFPWLFRFVDEGRVRGELFKGPWANVGSPRDRDEAEKSGNFIFS